MPALITHHFFGLEVLTRWTPYDRFSTQERQAFLLGCQGSDPLYFSFSDALNSRSRHLASQMHCEKVVEVFEWLRKGHTELSMEQRRIAEAYARGWLCHFSLDSTAHPLVYYYEQEICSAGVAGLDLDSRAEVHLQIESDIDAGVLYRRAGQTIRSFRPMDEIMLVDNRTLQEISQLFGGLAAEVYGVDLSGKSFLHSCQSMRLSYNLVYSPSGAGRALIGSLERLVRKHSAAQAVSHRVDVGEYSDFDNQAQEQWVNPFTGEACSSSFEQLFYTALEQAVIRMEQYSQHVSSEQLVGSLNYMGSIIN
ncbi:MAG: peptidase [Coriobacteriia bacterium]|nr:peptidase [Coriobacteriia bacterium]